MTEAATNRQRLALTVGEPVEDAGTMPGRAYRSALKPFYELIRQHRRADKSWREIAELLEREKGVKVTGRAINKFFASMRRRTHWPLGMEPHQPTASASQDAAQTEPPSRGTSRILGTVRGQAAATPEAEPVRGRRSQIFPHLAFIRQQRQAGESWRQIAEALAARGVQVSHQAVSDYFKRTQARTARRVDETNLSAAPIQPTPAPASPTPDSDRPGRPGSDDPVRSFLS